MDSDQLKKIGINVDENARVSKNPYLIQNKGESIKYSVTTANRYKEEEKMKKVSKQNYPRTYSILSKAKNDVNSQSIDRNLFRKGVAEILSGLKSDNVLVGSKNEDSKLIDMMDKMPTAFTSIDEIKNLRENPTHLVSSESNLKIENSNKPGVIRLSNSKNESELKQNVDESVRKEEIFELQESEHLKERVSGSSLSAWHTFKNKGKFRYNQSQTGSCEETNTFLDNLKKRRPKEEAKTASIKTNFKTDSQAQIKRKSPTKRIKDADLNKDEKSTRKYIDEFLLRSHMMKQRTDDNLSHRNFLNKENLASSNKELNLKESHLIQTVNIEDESDEENDVINIEGTYNYFQPLMNSNSLSQLDYKLPRNLSEFLSKGKEKRIHQQKYQNELLNSLVSKSNATFNSTDNFNRYNNNKDYYSKTETKESFNFKLPRLSNKESRGGVIDLSTLASNSKIKTAKGYIDRRNVLEKIKSAAVTKRYGLHHDFKLMPTHIKAKYNSASSNQKLIESIITIQSWWRYILMNANSNAAIFIQKVYRGHLVRFRMKEYSLIFNEIGGKLSLLENFLRKRILSQPFDSLNSYEKPCVIVCNSVVDYFTSGSQRKIIFSNLVSATKSLNPDFTEKIKLIQKTWRGYKEYKLFKLMRSSKKTNKGLLEIFHEEEILIEGALKKKQVVPGVYIEKKIYSNFMEKKVKEIQAAFALHTRRPKRVLRFVKISTPIHYEKIIITNILNSSHILSIQNQWQIYLKMKKQKIEKIMKIKRIFTNSALTKESHCNFHFNKISEIHTAYKNYLTYQKKSALVIIKKNVLTSLTCSKQIKNSIISDNVNKIIRIFRLKNSEQQRNFLTPKNYLLTSRCSFSKKIKSEVFLAKISKIQKNWNHFIKRKHKHEQLSLNMMKNIPVIKSKPILNLLGFFEKITKTMIPEKKITKLQKNIRKNQPCSFISVKRTIQPFRISKRIVSIDSLMKIILIQRKIKEFAFKTKAKTIPVIITKKMKIPSKFITKEKIKVINVYRKFKLHSLVVTKKSECDYSQIFSEKISKIQKLFKANLKTKIIPIMPVTKHITRNSMYTKQNIFTRFLFSILFIQSQLRRYLIKLSLEKRAKRKVILNPLKINKRIINVNGLLKVIILQKKWKQILLMKQKEKLISEPRQRVKTITPVTITKRISFNKIIQIQKILFLQEKIKKFVERIPRKIIKIGKLLSTGGSNRIHSNTCSFTKNVKTFYPENSIRKIQNFTKDYLAFTQIQNKFRKFLSHKTYFSVSNNSQAKKVKACLPKMQHNDLAMIAEDDLIEEPEIDYDILSGDDINEKQAVKSSRIPKDFLTLLNEKIIMSIRRDVISGIERNYTDTQLRFVSLTYLNSMFNKSFFEVEKFEQIKRRINLIDFIYTLSQSITKTSQEYVFRKLSSNFRRGSQISILVQNSRSKMGKQNHYYSTIRRFTKLLGSYEDDLNDEKNKEIVYKHFIRIFPKNYAKNTYSHKWCNLKERSRDEDNLREACLFNDKGDQNLLRFMEFVAKKERNLHNLRKFFIARLHKIKTLNNSNIFALANLTDRFYQDLKSKYLCQTCYCKEGEENEKFNNQFYCNCDCHLEIREQEESIRESERESENESIRESVDMGSFSYYDDLSKLKINRSEDIGEDKSMEIKLNLIKKEKKEKRDSASNLSSYRGDFMARLSKRQSKITKIDNLFRKAEKSMIKTQEELESKKSILEIDDSSKRSAFGEDSRRSFFEKNSRKILLDISRKTMQSFLSIEEELLNGDKEKDGIMHRENVEINLIKKFDSEVWKKPSNDELTKVKAEVFPRVLNKSSTSNDESARVKPVVFQRVQNKSNTNKISIRSEDGESKINVIPTFTSNKNKIPTTFSHTRTKSLLKKSINLQKDKTLILRDENFTNDDY